MVFLFDAGSSLIAAGRSLAASIFYACDILLSLLGGWLSTFLCLQYFAFGFGWVGGPAIFFFYFWVGASTHLHPPFRSPYL